MKITINKRPSVDDASYYSENYSLKTSMRTGEDATAYEVLAMVYKAMIIEGYYPNSIVRCMKEFVRDWEYDNEKIITIEEE